MAAVRVERKSGRAGGALGASAAAGSVPAAYAAPAQQETPARPPTPPAHHVMASGAFRAPERVGFQNPWASWHTPSAAELLSGLEWGEREGCASPGVLPALTSAVRQALLPLRPHALHKAQAQAQAQAQAPNAASSSPKPSPFLFEPMRRRNELPLTVETPDFRLAPTDRAAATWLGHAGVLVQLPGLDGRRPLRVLFDPIFSARCSPSQLVGPHRFFPSPCTVEALPEIDLVIISHNHYDHLDFLTVSALRARFGDAVQFLVPLGNKAWFVQYVPGISPATVHEFDWWDEVEVGPASVPPGSGGGGSTSGAWLRVICTPAQHGSGRTATDANHTLWASWMLEHHMHHGSDVYRVFFGGDSGYRFHVGDLPEPDDVQNAPAAADDDPESARSTPPPPSRSESPTHVPRRAAEARGPEAPTRPSSPLRGRLERLRRAEPRARTPDAGVEPRGRAASHRRRPHGYPSCPAFAEIATRLGAPDLLLLPVSVGATFAYFKSFDVLPDWISPFPRLSDGLTGANHMSAADAVTVFRIMTQGARRTRPPVCLGIHWGTFVEGPAEIAETLYRLERACAAQDVRFAREYTSQSDTPTFALVNHGQSLQIP